MLHAKDGTPLATGYIRVVHGGRGDYVELSREQIIWDNFRVPANQAWRLLPEWADRAYYVEWRSTGDSNVMLYDQKRLVGYADYKIGMLYIAPNDIQEQSWTKV